MKTSTKALHFIAYVVTFVSISQPPYVYHLLQSILKICDNKDNTFPDI